MLRDNVLRVVVFVLAFSFASWAKDYEPAAATPTAEAPQTADVLLALE
ncbi:MAG: hypothetical protein KC912_17860 [Proteobacteria bacterium]|nr:hypothetical protein [Pseudomonadota bacterium]